MIDNRDSKTIVIIQARMSSKRFPGKVLAPLWGKPVIYHVISVVQKSLPFIPIVVATSIESSDDHIAHYVKSLGIDVFRGSLNSVYDRFHHCIKKYSCEWFLRISADSPLIDPNVIQKVAAELQGDIVTTIFPRTFPKGTNAELIKTSTFLNLNQSEFNDDDREHVTAYYYRFPDRFKIINIESGNPELAKKSIAVDSAKDLETLENLKEKRFIYPALSSEVKA